jgi:hypothetical protein
MQKTPVSTQESADDQMFELSLLICMVIKYILHPPTTLQLLQARLNVK